MALSVLFHFHLRNRWILSSGFQKRIWKLYNILEFTWASLIPNHLRLRPSSPKLNPLMLLSSNMLLFPQHAPCYRAGIAKRHATSWQTLPFHLLPSLGVFLYPQQVGMIICQKLLDIPQRMHHKECPKARCCPCILSLSTMVLTSSARTLHDSISKTH